MFNKIMRPIFNVPGIGAYALFMGIISGYPIGAKIVTNFRNENLCTKEEAERLITFTNNSGPLFILGTVGVTLFYDSSIGESCNESICLDVSNFRKQLQYLKDNITI